MPRRSSLLTSLFIVLALLSFPVAGSAHSPGHRLHKRASGGNRALTTISRAHRVEGRKRRKRRTPRARAAGSKNAVGKAVAVGATSSTSSADLLFRGDSMNDFWVNHSAPGAIKEVADPAGGGESAFQMSVSDQDVYPVTPTENPRAELLSPAIIQPEDELWWTAKFYLPSDFPSSVPGWLTLLEGPYGPPFNGTPPWQIAVEGEHIEWSRNGNYNWDVPWQMPLVRGSWVSVMVHEKFGTEGWVEMWIDGKQITFFNSGGYNPDHFGTTQRLAMETMDFSNSGGANSIYLMSYREAGMFGSVTVDQGPLSIGTTQASVES